MVSASYDMPDGGEGTVFVAGARDDVDESIAELTTSLAWIVPLAVLALLAVVWMVVGRTLRPVERIRAQVAGIGVAELDRRVPEPGGDDEIARLAVTMNEMLARLERSVRRQQRFVADASHELRTPLTRMRAELEVDERDPAGADAAATRRSQLEEIAGLQRMIEDLLLLARSDAGTPSRRSEPVDLDDIVLEEIRASGRSAITVDASRVSAAQVLGDPDELRRVVRNLIDNACRHANTNVESSSPSAAPWRPSSSPTTAPASHQNVGPTCSNASLASTNPDRPRRPRRARTRDRPRHHHPLRRQHHRRGQSERRCTLRDHGADTLSSKPATP